MCAHGVRGNHYNEGTDLFVFYPYPFQDNDPFLHHLFSNDFSGDRS